MGPVSFASSSRLLVAGWDGRGYWLTDLDSPRRLRVDGEGTVVETTDPFPDAVDVPAHATYPAGSVLAAQVPLDDSAARRAPKLPRGVPDGWTVRWDDRWAVLAMFDKLFVGRGAELEAVVHLDESSDKIRAYPPGVVIHLSGRDHAFPWDAFDRAEIFATPLVVELSPLVRRPVRVSLAGKTILRVEILEPEPGWTAAATLASNGNPLGLAPGDEVFAVGNVIDGRFEITRVFREDPGPIPTSLTRGEPARVARAKARPPAWIGALVRAGLVGSADDVPEHAWTGSPVDALVAIHEPRGALDRGFVWFRLAIRSSTRSPIADLERMAQVPKGSFKGVRVAGDDDFDGFAASLEKVNARLDALGATRRVREISHRGPFYALVARTPAELEELEAAGLELL